VLRYMLDTNTCIFVMKDQPSWLPGKFNRHLQQICISTIALGELRTGAEKSQRRAENLDVIEEFKSRVAVLDFDQEAAREYGRIRAELRRHPIGALDMLIAGHARSRTLVVVTDNVREFRRVLELQVENWIRRT
jgi:tRNA(fMet)-specific endonuclease VapC